MKLVMIVSAKDATRAIAHLSYIELNLPVDEVVIIGNRETEEIVEQSGKKVTFLDEDEVYQGLSYNNVDIAIKQRNSHGGRTGWYFQQFLKMAYAFCCKDDYYLVWDGDTIPVRKIELFDNDGHPFMALKEEYNKPYFDTMNNLLGLKKGRKESFISEHMLIHVGYMKEMITEIEKQSHLQGNVFFEKILSAVEPEMLSSSGFSEYETYGTYVTEKYPQLYHCIPYYSCRHTISMIGYNPTSEQIEWLAGKYEAISFEKWDTPIKGLTRLSEKKWFRMWIGIEKYDKICWRRCTAKFAYGKYKRKLGRKVKKLLGINRVK